MNSIFLVLGLSVLSASFFYGVKWYYKDKIRKEKINNSFNSQKNVWLFLLLATITFVALLSSFVLINLLIA